MLKVNFIGQNDPAVPDSWKSRSCAIVCLKMCMDFYGSKNSLEIPSIKTLIDEGLVMKPPQYDEKIGWSHDALVWIARNNGVPAYRQGFRSDKIDTETGEHVPSIHSERMLGEGIKRIKESLSKDIPVIVSLAPGFGSNNSTHQVVLIGDDEEGFFLHDPSDSNPKESHHISNAEFLKFWRKYAIFVG